MTRQDHNGSACRDAGCCTEGGEAICIRLPRRDCDISSDLHGVDSPEEFGGSLSQGKSNP